MPGPEPAPNAMSLAFVEELYADYLQDPNSVPEDWRAYFAGTDGNGFKGQLGPSFAPASVFNPPSPRGNGQAASSASSASSAPAAPVDQGRAGPPPAPNTQMKHAPLGSMRPVGDVSELAIKQDRVDQLIRAYRVRGHMIAKIDPLDLPRGEEPPELAPEFYGLSEADLDRRFSSRTIYGTETLTLREIIDRLKATYCQSVGVQFMHIDDLATKNWLQERMEGVDNRITLSHDEQRRILSKLTDAVMLEEFVQKKFLGAKSFSLEGSESLIPLLDLMIDRAAEHGVNEIVLGMAHRGRLNVLANIMGKSPRDIFREFEDVDPELYRGSGDVKYHMGYSSDYTTSAGSKLHLSLCFNPSHLEFVNPVVQGRVRAKQDRAGDIERLTKIPVLIHGDAAFAGEGIVPETLNLSELIAYHVGGTVHIVVNNQIGFTTPPWQSRSTMYATDVAKMLQSPIFHVNGEDPDAVAHVVRLAMDFRMKFKRDVVIDMYGYRRHGHNEGDEPAFTQPVLYRAIAQRKSVRDGYLDHLLKLGGITQEEADQIAVDRRDNLETELSEARKRDFVKNVDWLGGVWQGYCGGAEAGVKEFDTGVDRDLLVDLLQRQTKVPSDFHPHKKIERLLEQRADMAAGKRGLDWGTAEALAFATLLMEGTRVRITGQDSGRGTFSQRHAVLYDVEDGRTYTPLAKLSGDQAPVEIYNSPLSEAGVMGFEWGYSLDWPDGLVVWEGQFGDFANAAQVIIDQFIVSAEDKWKRLSGLVLLLPHGFEGMGPEHSSARIERFLTLAAEENIQIVEPSTPAQYFHCLRRQAVRKWRKPLVVFTPKSLLRHPDAVSPLDDLATGRFQRVIADDLPVGGGRRVTRVFLCSGKVYYELMKRREELGREDIAIVRIEQYYPLADEHLRNALSPYPDGTPVIWIQNEPENMGAWRTLRARFGEKIFGRLPFSGVCRPESASPATGSNASHKLEQQELMERAFGGA
ncbi:MAG: 2-oxoglutarate dehydrogenase E1 component [Polyangiaceae bacterium]|nr:2-oxoglutarate dehydrogenase E1 component [Polyangiaceae bacterium]